MDKLLPVLCVATAVLAGVFAIVFSGVGASLLLLALVAAVAVAAILQRDRFGVVTGVVLLVVALVGTVVALGTVSLRGNDVGNAGEETGFATAIAIALLAAVAIVPARWGRGRATWVAFAGVAVALLGILYVYAVQEGLGNYVAGRNYGVAVLAFACGVPAVLALVGRGEERSAAAPARTTPAAGRKT